jgi:acyl phosphate:glycerol-3-phosphate acyltransferase
MPLQRTRRGDTVLLADHRFTPAPGITIFTLAAYLIGCVSPGYLLVRHRTAHDVRHHGSGGTGARNVGRVLGPRAFAIVFLADCAKGAAAVALAGVLGAGAAGLAAAMLAVVLGHVFPVQLGFRGGKGASTALGALLVVDARVAITALLLCAAVYAVLRRATASGLIVFSLLPVIAVAFGHRWPGAPAIALLALLLLAAHRENLAAMLRHPRATRATAHRAAAPPAR